MTGNEIKTPDRPRSAAIIVVTVACLAAALAGFGLLSRAFDRPAVTRGSVVAAVLRRTVPLAVQPGLSVITVHGLTVSVPDSWRQVIGHPCIVSTDLVMLPASATPDCGTGRAKGVSTVEFFEGRLGTSLVARPPTAIRIDGTAGTRTTFSDVRASYIVVEVPSLQLSVETGAPTAAEAERLQATLRITSGDAHGCPSRAPNSHRLTALGPALRDGADRSLLPAGAGTVTLCRYQDGWLEQGAELPAAQLASFAASMNALPAGLSRASDQDEACRSAGENPTGQVQQSAQDGASYLVFAGYPSGPAVTVVVRLALCGELGASNGTRTAQRTGELITLVTSLAGDAQGYPQQVTAA